jgi:DNA end-binding protein Ku
MFFPDEIRDQDAVVGDSKKVSLSPRELTMAKQLIKSLEETWDPRKLKDTYRDRVLDLIHRKARGEEITQEAPREPKGEVIDLMEALKASLGSGGRREAKGAGKNRDKEKDASNGESPRGRKQAAAARGPRRRTTARHRAHAA